jgi:hypothetical protein
LFYGCGVGAKSTTGAFSAHVSASNRFVLENHMIQATILFGKLRTYMLYAFAVSLKFFLSTVILFSVHSS